MRWGNRSVALALFVMACGGAGAGPRTPPTVSIEPADFLMEVGATWSSVLRRPERGIDELESARRQARGPERRQVTRELAIAHLFASETAEEREARRLRRRGEEMADATSSGSRDARLTAEMEFVKLWMSWRAGARNAASRASRFTDRHREDGGLHTLAWMIRGELALAADQHEDALTAFRVALGRLDHPLYAYALWRSAQAYERLGRTEDAEQALREAEQLGCASEASPFVQRIALAVAEARGTGARRDADGVTRPATCATPAQRGSGEWRPAE